MQLIPSIDVRGGRTVRLLYGDYEQETVYDADPVETAVAFEQAGAKLIHVVDLDGARSGSIQNWDVLGRIFAAVSIEVEVGGGIRTIETARQLLDKGAAKVVFGTALMRDADLPAVVFGELGAAAIAGIDARDGQVAVAGWREQSSVDALEFARQMQSLGCKRIILTDISRDGALTGPNLEFQERFARALDMEVIASGGVTTLGDLQALTHTGVAGAIVGRAIYEGKFTVAQGLAALR